MKNLKIKTIVQIRYPIGSMEKKIKNEQKINFITRRTRKVKKLVSQRRYMFYRTI